jgi:hypothetical protein
MEKRLLRRPVEEALFHNRVEIPFRDHPKQSMLHPREGDRAHFPGIVDVFSCHSAERQLLVY